MRNRTRLIAIQRYYRGNNIDSYDIQDVVTGEVRNFELTELKDLMRNNKIYVANLQLTSDNKVRLKTDFELIDSVIDHNSLSDNNLVLEQHDKDRKKFTSIHNVEDAFLEIVKRFDDSYSQNIKVIKADKDTNILVIVFNTSKFIKSNTQIVLKWQCQNISNHPSVVDVRMQPNWTQISIIPIAVKCADEVFNISTLNLKSYAHANFYIDSCTYDGVCPDVIDAYTKDHNSWLDQYARNFRQVLFNVICSIVAEDKKATTQLNKICNGGELPAPLEFIADNKEFVFSNAAIGGLFFTLAMLLAKESGMPLSQMAFNMLAVNPIMYLLKRIIYC